MHKNTILLLLLSLFALSSVSAQEKNKILIKNVNIFDGIHEETIKGNILIKNNKIDKVSRTSISVKENELIETVNGQGKHVIPGLIDAHTHVTSEDLTPEWRDSDWGLINLIAGKAAKRQLARGFTTIRNMGGNAIPVSKAIDHGFIDGPRIFPSGAFISQSGGHGDNGSSNDVPRTPDDLSYAEQNGETAIADGVPEVLKRTREQFRQGATQIKLMAGGGISSDYDPIDVAQFTEKEFKAAVSAAENFDSYVAVHVYTPEATQTAIKAGIKCIEHGHLIDDETAKLMAQEGVWWDIQPFIDDEDAPPFSGENKRKWKEVSKGTDNAYKLAKKYNVKTAFGTDITGNPDRADLEGKWLTKLKKWYSPYEILKMATSDNAKLLRLSGERNPYNEGKLGEITEGAYADLLLVDGNPLKDIDLVANPDKNFLLIIKDGDIHKNKTKEK